MNSPVIKVFSHPVYSLIFALTTGAVAAKLSFTLFFDTYHNVYWFDSGVFFAVVLTAFIATATQRLTLRNRQIALYLIGYLVLHWYSAPETMPTILIKALIIGSVTVAVVRTVSPVYDNWRDVGYQWRALGIACVALGSLIISQLQDKPNYVEFAEQFLPTLLAIISARILLTAVTLEPKYPHPFKFTYLIPVVLLVAHILFVNLAPDALLRPGIIISLSLLSAAIILPFRLFCLFLPSAIILNAIEFSISPYTQAIVTDRVLLTLSVVALISSFIASTIRKLQISRQTLQNQSSELNNAINRFEKISSVSNIALFEQNDPTGSLWINDALRSLIGVQKETELNLDELLSKLTLDNEPLGLEIFSASSIQPFKAITTIRADQMATKKALFTINQDEKGFYFGSMIDQTELIERGEIAVKAKKQTLELENANKELIALLEQAAENTAFDVATIDHKTTTFTFAFDGKSINFPASTVPLEEILQRIKQPYQETLRHLLKGTISHCQVPIYLTTNDPIWWSIDNIGTDANGNINLFIQDITRSKLTNDRVLKARTDAEAAIRKLNITTDTSGIGIFEIDPINNKVRPSATLRDILNLPATEFVSLKGFLGFFDMGINSRFTDILSNLSSFEGPEHLQVSILDESGRRYFDITLTGQGLLSVDRQILGSLIETTDRQTLLEESRNLLNQSNQSYIQLQERFESEKKLFGIIAHEIRTPVSAIKMMLEDDSDHTEEIDQSINHLLELIDDLRNVVKPEQQTARQRKGGHVQSTVQNILRSMQVSAKEANINLVLSEQNWTDYETYFDSTALKQIIINLLRNALIHSDARTISIDLSKPSIDTNIANYTIKISDDGRGIEQEYLNNLFDAYYRGNTKADGSGIGLYLCQQLANELGGTIQYEDTPGGGATFVITLALDLLNTESDYSSTDETSDPSNSPKSTPSSLDLSSKRVLVAEDNLMIRTLTKKMIEGLGAEVVAQEDGQLALDAAKESEFDLVVTDIFMPNLDGYGLASGLREIGFTGPIVGVSAATIGEERDRLLEAGASVALAKPISVEKLTEALQSIDPQSQSE